MHSSNYIYNDDDFDRFVLGSGGGMEPGSMIGLFIVLAIVTLWWFT